MSVYQIIDEPKTRAQDFLICNPLLILLIGVFLPIFWNPPFNGRIWGPFLWLAVNGFLLGSPTFKKELGLAILAVVCWYSVVYGFGFFIAFNSLMDQVDLIAPYVRILNQALFFLFLYLVVFLQSTPFSIYEYLKEQGR